MIFPRIADAPQLGPLRGVVRTMHERVMTIANVIEKVDGVAWQQQGGGDGVHGGIAPALVEEAAGLVEMVEEVEIGLGAQPGEAANLKVGPLASARG